MFSLFRKKKDFFTKEEQQQIIEAIRKAERMTSGEVRVFVESRCSYMDAVDRAAELFFRLGMQKTDDRNAVLVYVAMEDKQLAVFADENIYNKTGDAYWNEQVTVMCRNFNQQNFAAGIRQVVTSIGDALTKYFPYSNDTDKNELPDDIVFGN
jgi:uncharacterized membrane protein